MFEYRIFVKCLQFPNTMEYGAVASPPEPFTVSYRAKCLPDSLSAAMTEALIQGSISGAVYAWSEPCSMSWLKIWA